MHVLLTLQTLFLVWMLYDAVKRGVPYYWMIVLFVPFGPLVYFLAIVLPELRGRSGFPRGLFARRVSVEELRREVEVTPSHSSRLRLAQALHDEGQHAEALPLFRAAVEADDRDKEALHGFARCAEATGDREAAVRALEHLAEIAPSYRDHEACFELARLHHEMGRGDQAIALLEGLCKRTGRIGPRTLLAEHLIAQGRAGEARQILDEALQAYSTSPPFTRRLDRALARRARALVRLARAQSSSRRAAG